MNIEIVVSDDGSTDGTKEIIDDFAAKYPDKIIPLVGGPNLGITGNSNRALSHCRGKYIAFIGGDDIFLPGKISRQVQWMEADDRRVLCGHQVEVFYQDGRPSHLHTRRLRSGNGPDSFIRHGPLFCAMSVMVRTSNIPYSGFDPAVSFVSDGLFFIETLIKGGAFGYIKGVYGRYRRHDNNITNQWDRCVDDFVKVLQIIRERYRTAQERCWQALQEDYQLVAQASAVLPRRFATLLLTRMNALLLTLIGLIRVLE